MTPPLPPADDDDERTTLLGPEPASPTEDGLAVGQQVGPYRLLTLLGEGGMGQVFLAEQREPIRRQVALKLIRRQLAGSLAEAYFEVERQALARMDHPAIAKVFDAGRTPQGWPYFAMEYVEGRPLDLWRREDAPDLRTRLRALIGLAYGVQHAHQRGIVHRDLKPSNVLIAQVDGRPQPKLIDFGIAVGVDQKLAPDQRSSYERAGSGPYMSPEQFAGDAGAIDIRTDIYSLGMVLLGQALPLPGLRALGEPVPAREALHARLRESLARRGGDAPLDGVPAELRHIVARATDPQRENRYASAVALADDLQRYLDGYAVDAVPASRRYQLAKFVRRRRRPLALVGAALLALVVGLGVALWGLLEAERQATRSQATSDFLATVLAGVDPDRARDLDKTLMRSVLDEAAQRATTELAGQPAALAEIEEVIANSYVGLGEYTLALDHARRARDLAQAEYGATDVRTLAKARGYARTLVDTGAAREAEPLIRATVAGLHAALGPDHLTTLKARHTLGWTLREIGEYPVAEAEFADVVDRLRGTVGEDHEETLEARFGHAILLGDLERYPEAIAELRDLVALRERLLGADHARTLSVRNSLAVAYLQSKRFADGEVELRAMLPLYERVFGADSTLTLMIHANLGGALRQQGKVEESGPHYQHAADGYRERFGASHPRALLARHNYGNYLFDTGRFEESYAANQEARELGRAVFGEEHPAMYESLTGLGRAAVALGRYREGEQALLEAWEQKTRLLGPDSLRLENTREGLIALYTALGRPEEADRYRVAPEPAPSAPVPSLPR